MKTRSVCIELSNQCPLKCLHCSTNASPAKNLFFGSEEIFRLTQTFIAQKLETVYLSGGEPLLNPHTIDMIRSLSNSNIATVVYSSGVVFGSSAIAPVDFEYCKKLKSAGLNAIAFSIYSMQCAIHDKITKTTNSLNILKQSIANFVNCGVEVEINFVPFEINRFDLEDIILFCIGQGIKNINVQKAIVQGRMSKHKDMLMSEVVENEFKDNLVLLANKYTNINLVASKLFHIDNNSLHKSIYSADVDEKYIAIPYHELPGRKYRYIAQ